MAVFDENEDLQNVEDRYLHGRTMLTEWFEMNRRYEEVRKLKYIEMLTMFVWDNSNKIYIKRQQRGSIGRIVNINPAAGDKYYLGILVSLVRGPTCYDDLYTVGEIKYDTFQEACYARGFLGTDKDWHDSITKETLGSFLGIYGRRCLDAPETPSSIPRPPANPRRTAALYTY
uniref:Uncharacterized protein n=1 Tax=Brassica oleracea var. oleracea TaxID=109376 RepID=A0A0D2ZXW6_BRAOL